MTLLREQFSTIIFLLLFAGYQTASHLNEDGDSYIQDEPLLSDYRLPKTIIPNRYEILLRPKLEGNFEFKGTVQIEARVNIATDTITLHSGQLTINNTIVSDIKNVNPVKIESTDYNNVTEKYAIKLGELLKVGTNIKIVLVYTGKLRDDMIGFYKSSYIDSNGKIRWLASTQFQTTHARHAFPCFDEPSFKARFIIRILRPAGYNTISNMPLNRTVNVNSTEYWDEYQESIPMSTYLVAFIVSDFKSTERGTTSVWARPNALPQSTYALDIGERSVKHLSQRFNQSYQISKLDMAAVPDFSAGAMENWGLITYRESRMLYDSELTSDAAKQTIASVIVHEVTHMWFGNQVTPEWWSYLWLSEAFARYFQYFGTAMVEPTWKMEDQFIVEQQHTAYASDGVETSQPMTREVLNSSQVSQVGDTITYNKGACIVRMMNLIFGPEVFDAGLHNYLANTDKVGRPEDLWKELQNEINRRRNETWTVKDVMTPWTEQPGYPVLDVNVENKTIIYKQKRFLLRNLKSTSTNKTWWIPLTWANKENPNFDNVNPDNVYWITKSTGRIDLADKPLDWIIFNVQSSGFYRVNYDNASWYRIINALNSDEYQKIHVLNRAALVDDLFNLARADLLSYVTALDGVKYLTLETNYLPFKAAFSALTYLDQRFSGNEEYYQHLKDFILILIDNIYKQLGFTDQNTDDRLTVLLRGELNKLACNYGHKECINTFTSMFQQWKQKNTPIKPNYHSVAYCMGVKYGKEEDWEFLWKQYFNSNSATHQETILRALGCTENAKLLERYLSYALKDFEETRIRKQDISTVYSAVYGSSKLGAEFVLNYVEKHYDEMVEFYDGTGTITSTLSSASQRFSTQELVNKFELLINVRKLDSLKDSLDIAKYELKRFNNFAKDVVQWVIDYNQNHGNQDRNTEYRLPGTVQPRSYSILVATDVNEADHFTFTGTVNIDAVVINNTQAITLHSSGLTHENISVLVNSVKVGVSVKVVDVYDFLVLQLDKQLTKGQILTIDIAFKGQLNEEEMRGFYRSWYIDGEGKKRNEKVKYIFQQTPKMSSYLVVLVVSEFEKQSENSPNEIYGVWARANAIENAKYALSVMKPLVNFYENITGIKYQLPKLDMVALPDFVSGAMENWGLLTYKERNVLFNSGLSTTASEQSIINVISHEIAHQWFGDLVSPLWWKYLWLNEGFARYFQYFGTDSIRNDWSLESQFVVEQVHSAFEADSGRNSHPMTHDVYSPTEIRGIFDTISYGKAGSVIRMIGKILGRDKFYTALGNYLKNREYDAATPEDLFNALQKVADAGLKDSIHAIMNSWTTQAGYPVVDVTRHQPNLTLQQRRFFLRSDQMSSKELWYIPITWTKLEDANFNEIKVQYWLKDSEVNLTLPSNDVYLLNLQQTGYYRINYDLDTWEQIIQFLKSDRYSTIHEINRAALIDDLLNLGRAGAVSYSIVLPATQYLINETNYFPWRAFFNGLSYLHKQFEGKEGYTAFLRYTEALLTPVYKNLGFEDKDNDTHVTKLFRSHVRSWACKLNLLDCKNTALAYFVARNSTVVGIPPNILAVSYCAYVANRTKDNDESNWKNLWNDFSGSNFAAQKSIILQSYACSTNERFLNDLLTKAITKDSGIRFEDSSGVFTSVINAGPHGVKLVIEFIKTNYDKMVAYYKQVSNVVSIVNTVGKNVYSNELYELYLELVNELTSRLSTENWKSNKNAVEYELNWAKRNIPKIFSWLEQYYSSTDYRLPRLFTPLKYDIFLTPKLTEASFAGKVQIELKRSANYLSHIVLHAHKLNITGVHVYESSNSTKGSELSINRRALIKVTQMYWIFLNNFVKSDQIIVELNYTGTLNDNMQGFYRSYYFTRDKQVRWLATTQFEPTYARQAFPCLDEPSLKAIFEIHIERPKNYKALSNMPVASTDRSTIPNYELDHFEKTFKMSTYLVAFAVTDFEVVRPGYDRINVWGRPDIASKGDYAQTIATQVLEYLHQETGHAYSLPKLDLIGIPDFQSGAMENWGLITFREYGLFYDGKVTTTKYTDYIITIIAHELAHTSFGNLVTCDWWEYIWLNEGFAEYMQWRFAHLFKPSFGFDDLFVVDELQPALLFDGSSSTHPMTNPVSKPSEIKQAFDTVTYGKGSSVIRMIYKSLNPKVFQKAINKYLDKHQYSTATPKDLWESFDTVIKEEMSDSIMNNMSIATLMDGWTNKKGYPIVFATMNGTLILEQKNLTGDNSGDFWIPITLTTASKRNFENTLPTIWLSKDPEIQQIDKSSDWFIVNVQQSGYYRVNYDKQSWSRLIDALNKHNHSSIHVTNRAQIIDDLLNLARADLVSYDIALKGSLYLKNEMEYLPWKAFFNGINFIIQRLQGQAGLQLVKNYITHLAEKLYRELDFVDNDMDEHLDRLSRDLILTWMCKLDHESCVNQAMNLFNEWRRTMKNNISPNARPAVYCTAVRDNNTNWNFLWEQYLSTNLASEQRIMLDALGCARNESSLKSYVSASLRKVVEPGIRKQDVNTAFASIYNSGEAGVNFLINFIVKEYKQLHDYYGDWDSVGDLISKVASRISTYDQQTKLNELRDDKNVGSMVKSALAVAHNNLEWSEKHLTQIIKWIKDQQDSKSAGTTTVVNTLSTISLTVFSIMVYAFSQ
ncbi:putative aminopeptidase-2 [Ceratina calcarata]|uniref:Aminopeptidase N n=1 Tax=Ceratina calcarata TaxID=156304 RepID=A0AAJ7JG50_9HYME|nr:putative aminopeptidase-2 [Ceratina calcarata]